MQREALEAAGAGRVTDSSLGGGAASRRRNAIGDVRTSGGDEKGWCRAVVSMLRQARYTVST